MKVALTGGHLTTALAVIEELRKIENSEIFFLGRAHTAEGDKTPSAESIVIPNLGIKFYAIKAGRLQRRFSAHTILSLARVPLGLIQSLIILSKEKPDVVVSFGSYVAFPVILAAWILGIPSITHEQTVKAGLANKLIATFVKKIALSWEDSKVHFPKNKTVVVGNPIRRDILALKKARTERPVIFITGGNQGSHVINEAVSDILADLLGKYEIIHQTGGNEIYKDYEKLKASSLLLSRRLQNRYKLTKWLNTDELVKVFSKASLVISRSGANTVTEIAALGTPAIFVPLPWAVGDEQTKNAKILESIGAAVILPQERLTPKRLLNSIDYVIKNYKVYKDKAKNAKNIVDKDAASNLVSEIKKLTNVNL